MNISGRQLRHRLKHKWSFMIKHCSINCLESTIGTTQSLLSSEIPMRSDTIENRMILAENSSFSISSSEYPGYRQDDEIILQPSFSDSQVFEMEALSYEDHQNRFHNLFTQPFESWEARPQLQLNFDLLDRLNPLQSPGLPCPGLVPIQEGLPWISNEFLSLSRFDHQVFNSSKRVNEGDILQLIIFMLDNNLLESWSKRRMMVIQYARSLPPEAIQSISLDFYNPETAETAEKLFRFALESNSTSIITAVIQSELRLPESVLEARFVFALRNRHLSLVQFLLDRHINLELKDPCTDQENWFIEILHRQWDIFGKSECVMAFETSELDDVAFFSSVHTKGMNLRQVKESHKQSSSCDLFDKETSSYREWIQSSLKFASSIRHLQLVRSLLKAKASPKSVPNIHSKDGSFRAINPLSAALNSTVLSDKFVESVSEDQTSSEELAVFELVQTLTEAGADVNSAIGCVRSLILFGVYPPICAAVSRGYSTVVRYLLSKGAKIQKGSSGQHALLCLFESKQFGTKAVYNIARGLIEAGIDVNITNGGGVSALDYAAQEGSSELIDLLLASGAIPSETTLRRSIQSRRLQLTHHILDTTTISMNALNLAIFAAHYGMNEVVGKLLDLAREKGHTWPSWFQYELQDDLTTEFIGTLLDSGFFPSSREALCCIQRLLTSKSKNLEHLRRLLEPAMDDFWNSGGDDCNFMDGPIVLNAAITLGDFQLADLLVECGVVGDSRSMDAALEKGNLQLFHRLLEAGLSRPYFNHEEIFTKYYSVLKDHHIIIMKLLARVTLSKPPNDSSHLCFAGSAIERGDMDVTKFLLEAGFGLNRVWLDSAIELAVQWKHSFLLSELLQAYRKWHGACDRGFGSKALHQAVAIALNWHCCGAVDKLEASKQSGLMVGESLLSFGVDPAFVTVKRHVNDRTQIMESVLSRVICSQWSAEKLQLLTMILKRVKSMDDIVEVRDISGAKEGDLLYYTPLLAAIEKGDISTVSLLLEAGANVNLPATFQTRRTPLQAASAAGRLEIFTLLLNKGADVHAPAGMYKGGTALQLAAIAGHLQIVYLLLAKNVNVNAPRARVGGRTAIEGAAEHGRVAVLELLLECGGAKIDGDGEDQYHRALRFAERNGHRKAIFMLKRAKE